MGNAEVQYAVVAILVELSLDSGVALVGFPVRTGLASVAYGVRLLFTYAVVAILVELSLDSGVALVGLPVNAGLERVA